MKKTLKSLTLIAVLAINQLSAQTWIDQVYPYDSLMNQTYGSATDFSGRTVDLQLDLFLPECGVPAASLSRPLMLVVHGGSFVAGDKSESSIQQICRQYAKRGYVTAAVNYRLGFVSDNAAHNCNGLPEYKCVFATDSIEWYRACYRGIQDVKGALRFLVNQSGVYGINPDQVFLLGESAGGFVALGTALLDVASEKFPQANAQTDAPMPDAGTSTCQYNVGITFSGPVARPDLGSIDGTIAIGGTPYTILGIGNMYGGMMYDLLAQQDVSKPKPVIYAFHQPCDMVVPADSGVVDQGFSWCMTNGYGCDAVSKTAKVYGSRAFSALNTAKNHGYQIQTAFTATEFPYSYLLGAGSCADQLTNPCHGYDNFTQRNLEAATLFAAQLGSSSPCSNNSLDENQLAASWSFYPNPVTDQPGIFLQGLPDETVSVSICSPLGQIMLQQECSSQHNFIPMPDLASGMYWIRLETATGSSQQKMLRR